MHKKLILALLFFTNHSFGSEKSKSNNETNQINCICNKIEESLCTILISNKDQQNQSKVYTFKNLSSKQIDDAFYKLYKDIIAFYQSINTNTITLKTHTEFLKEYYTQHPYAFSAISLICSLSIAHSLYTVFNKARKKQPQ